MKIDIEIKESELSNPAIDDIINLEKSLSMKNLDDDIGDIKTPFYLNPMFYYPLATFIGAIIVWAITEPFYDDKETTENIAMQIPFLSDYLLFGPVAAMVGLFIGIAYGISNRNVKQFFYCGMVCMGFGLVATVITTIVADIIFGIMLSIAFAFVKQPIDESVYPFKGVAFFLVVAARGIGWSIISLGSGLGLGIALKSKKLIFNGFAGGMIGGLLGGFLFDPITRALFSYTSEAAISRAVGIASVGIFVGFFIGLIENLSKESWFLMQKGPLTGKQFILFKNLTVIGSSPKAGIYLFKDSAIDPKHATVTKTGNKNIIKDENSETGVFVNGRKIDRYVLQNGDVITIGSTVLKYSEKQK